MVFSLHLGGGLLRPLTDAAQPPRLVAHPRRGFYDGSGVTTWGRMGGAGGPTAGNETALSEATRAVLERVGRVMGAAAGTGPDDDPWLGALRREARAEGRAAACVEMVCAILRNRGLDVSDRLAARIAEEDPDALGRRPGLPQRSRSARPPRCAEGWPAGCHARSLKRCVDARNPSRPYAGGALRLAESDLAFHPLMRREKGRRHLPAPPALSRRRAPRATVPPPPRDPSAATGATACG